MLRRELVRACAFGWPCPAAVAALDECAVVCEARFGVAFTAPGWPAVDFGFPLAVACYVAGLSAGVAVDQFLFVLRFFARGLWLL